MRDPAGKAPAQPLSACGNEELLIADGPAGDKTRVAQLLPVRNALVVEWTAGDLPLPIVAQRHPTPGLTAQREEMRSLNASS